MASVTLKLNPRNVRADGTRAILIEIIYKRKRKVINTGNVALVNQWRNGNIVATKHPGGKALQIELGQRVVQLSKTMMLAELANETPAVAFARLDAKTGVLLFDFMAGIIAQLQRAGKVGNARVYANTLKQLQKHMHNVPVGVLGYDYIKRFKEIKTVHGCNANGLLHYLRVLKAVCNEAIKMGHMAAENYPFKPGVMPRQPQTAKRWVPFWFVQTLECAPLTGMQHLARNVWLLGFYLRGADFIDIAHLTTANVKAGRIDYNRAKTGKPVSVAIHPKAAAILAQYNTGTGYLLPLINQPMQQNPQMYYHARAKVNQALRQIAQKLGAPGSISTKTNRHTWATRAKQLGISRDVIAEALTHTIRGVTDVYLAGFDAATLDAANHAVCGPTLCCINNTLNFGQ